MKIYYRKSKRKTKDAVKKYLHISYPIFEYKIKPCLYNKKKSNRKQIRMDKGETEKTQAKGKPRVETLTLKTCVISISLASKQF